MIFIIQMSTWIAFDLCYSDVHLSYSSSLFRCAPAWIQLFTTCTAILFTIQKYICVVFSGILTIHMYTRTSILQQLAHPVSLYSLIQLYMISPFHYSHVQMIGTFYCWDMHKRTSCITFQGHFKPLMCVTITYLFL